MPNPQSSHRPSTGYRIGRRPGREAARWNRRYSTWVPLAFTISAQRGASSAMKAAKSSTVPRLGIAPSLGSVKEFKAFIADEAPRWAEIVKASGTQID